MNKSILSCNYNDNDITEIIQNYLGPNKDFFSSNIDFRILVDDNFNLVYITNCDEINLIYGNLDLAEIKLSNIDFKCVYLLQK